MGKIRVKSFGDQEEEAKQARKLQNRKDAKEAKKEAEEKTDLPASANEALQAEEVKTEEITQEPKKEQKFKKKEQKEFRSQKYQSLVTAVDKTKIHSLGEALELLTKLQRGKFDETVELHLNTISAGISGNVTLPNGTGKKTKVAIADDALIAEVEKGVISFDILVATPSMMPKLAKVAKVLGPKGLMPNPKNGTITDKPEEVAKKYEGGQVNFKTETKTPIIHLTVGKMSFGHEKLTENINALITAVKKSNIVNATLKSTMSPGIKLKV
jgi:large subunit ribosomal protein L1